MNGFVEEGLDFGRKFGLECGKLLAFWDDELGDVVGASGFGTGADGGLFPAAEGLALDDGSGDGAVDVGVSGLDFVFPEGEFGGVEGVNAAGEGEGGGVLDGDGFVEGVEGDDGEDGAEEFGGVNPRAGFDAGADAG